MGRKLHKDDEFVKGMNYGAICILRTIRNDIDDLIDKYEEEPIRCMLCDCDGEGDSNEKIKQGIGEFLGYCQDPLSHDEKVKIRSELYEN